MLAINTRGGEVEVAGSDKRPVGRTVVRRSTILRYRAVLLLDGEGWTVPEIAGALGLRKTRVYEILDDLARIRRNRGLAELAA